MSEEVLTEDQSHYEISLTAGQAFIAFVLLLLSLAAAFAFGLLIGKGQNDDRLTLKRDSAVINEAAAPAPAKKKVTEIPSDDFNGGQPTPAVHASTPAVPPTSEVKPLTTDSGEPLSSSVTPSYAATPGIGPAYAQLLSSSDQKAAEALAEKLIGAGFNTAYVERMVTGKGTTFRVRVKFASEADAKAAEPKLKQYSKDVWITAK